MRTDHPHSQHIPQLRALWQVAFGDSDAFLDSFFATAYSPERCLCILEENTVAAALYWFDCTLDEQKLAYIYAVVTHPDYRNRGLCRQLMNATHALLAQRGYSSAVLVPQKESLRAMYAGMGYESFGGIREFRSAAADAGVSLRAVGPGEYAALRRSFLPEKAVLQEKENLAFLAQQAEFYTGDGFLLAAYREKEALHGIELLGDVHAAPGILKALGCPWGRFRTPGNDTLFAMHHPLSPEAQRPEYFGFAFD